MHCVDFLVQNGGGLEVVNNEGNTPLHTAVLHRQTECIKLLLKSGARYQAKNKDGKTPADLARERGYEKCLELIGESSGRVRQKGPGCCRRPTLLKGIAGFANCVAFVEPANYRKC